MDRWIGKEEIERKADRLHGERQTLVPLITTKHLSLKKPLAPHSTPVISLVSRSPARYKAESAWNSTTESDPFVRILLRC